MSSIPATTVLVSSRSFSTGDRDLAAEITDAGLRVVRVATDHDPAALAPAFATAAWIAGTALVTAALIAAAPSLGVGGRAPEHRVPVTSLAPSTEA